MGWASVAQASRGAKAAARRAAAGGRLVEVVARVVCEVMLGALSQVQSAVIWQAWDAAW
jgi:hypothetical protein